MFGPRAIQLLIVSLYAAGNGKANVRSISYSAKDKVYSRTMAIGKAVSYAQCSDIRGSPDHDKDDTVDVFRFP